MPWMLCLGETANNMDSLSRCQPQQIGVAKSNSVTNHVSFGYLSASGMLFRFAAGLEGLCSLAAP